MKKQALQALCLALSLAPLSAFAQEPPSDSLQGRLYQEYQGWREPCQNYQEPPAGYEVQGCHLMPIKHEEPAPPPPAPVVAAPPPPPPAPVVETKSYTVYFSVNKADLDPAAQRIVAQAADDIKAHKDVHVTVSGYASTTSTPAHNDKLSQSRVMSVSQALATAGVAPETVHTQAYGETDLAVPTPDKTEMPANRRAVIEFTGAK